MLAPHLRAKRSAILEQAKILHSYPRNINEIHDLFANVSTREKWRRNDTAIPSGSNSTIEHIFLGSGYPEDQIPAPQIQRFAAFLQLILANFGARPVSVAEAEALWAGGIETFKEALRPVNPFQSLLCAPFTRYHAIPNWEFEGYERQAGTVWGEEARPEDVAYHPDALFVHKMKFPTHAPKRVLMVSGIIGRHDAVDGIWSVYRFAPGRVAADNVTSQLKWPGSDPKEFPQLLTLVSGQDYEILKNPATGDIVVPVRDPETKEGRMTFLALGWFTASAPKLADIEDWAQLRTEGMHSTLVEKIARDFLRAQANGKAELCRCDIRFSLDGRKGPAR